MKNLQISLPSNRSFGITFAFITLVISFWNFLFNNGNINVIGVSISFLFFFFAFVFPKLLLPLNKLWSNCGVLLSFVMTPIIMSIIFFFVFTPIGLILRFFNKSPINLKKSDVKSYWVLRSSKDLSKNMKFQF